MELPRRCQMKFYLVGGAVRDLLLGVRPHDLDYTFQGTPEEFLAHFPGARCVGTGHSVYIHHGHEYSELVGEDILDDLMNRDFTFNSLALTGDGQLFHHPEALNDLRNRVFRAAHPRAFLDDPNRIFRLARFSACYPDWTIAPDTEALLASFPKELLARPAPERVGNELLKALRSAHPERFFTFLSKYHLLSVWFPELEAGESIPAGPPAYHRNTVFGHTMRVLQAVHGDPVACWMALCHDLGKIRTPEDILPHHYGHDTEGVPLAEALARRLHVPKNLLRAGKVAVAEHMHGGRYMTLRIGTRRDLLWRIFQQGLHDPFWKLVDADSGNAVHALADEELAILKGVRLPQEFRNLGIQSQVKLRDLQCMALVSSTVEQARREKKL